MCPAGAKAQKATCDANSCMADLKAVVPQGYEGDYSYSGNTIPPIRELQAQRLQQAVCLSNLWEQ